MRWLKWAGCWFGISLGTLVSANNLGVIGHVFPVAEIDMLVWIEQRLIQMQQSGEWRQRQALMQARVRAQVWRPTPVTGLSTTSTPRTFTVDASLTLPADIRDHLGRVLYRRGLRLNPLDPQTWPAPWVKSPLRLLPQLWFVDADDPRQLAWLQQQLPHAHGFKVILTRGAPQAVNQTLWQGQGRVYFDQGGRLSQRFQLRHVPSVVRAVHQAWQVTEIAIGGAV
jgi:conjugal transfer pilus assembly protein TraW